MWKKIRNAVIVVLLMYIFTGVFLVGLSAIVFYQELDVEVAEGGIMLIYMLTGFFGGRLVGVLYEKEHMLWASLGAGAGYSIIFLIISAGIGNEVGGNGIRLLMVPLLIIVATMLGAFVCRKKE